MPILHNISRLYTCAGPVIEDAAVVWTGDTIDWVGPRRDVSSQGETIDARGAIVVPGLIDCHTHLAFGGWRADEFELRSRGATYQDIAKAGGGILSTVRATRAASEDELLKRVSGFLKRMVALGVTTVECKTGYGLSLEHELKLLRVYERLAAEAPVEIVPTLLAAHTIPSDRSREQYLDEICHEIIPAAKAEFCDVFVEDGAFTPDEARRVFEAGTKHGMRPKLHADQLSDTGGAALAAEVGAVSADHLEYASDEGIEAMAAAGVVAVNLPLATLYLRQKPLRAEAFREAGVPIAVATDFNPGSAPSYHLHLAMTTACIQSRMSPEEALLGATRHAAAALHRADRIGSIEPGKRADLTLVKAPSVNHWLYHFRPNAVAATYAAGRRVFPT